MELGTFSISLSVKDMSVSRTFYENLGFSMIGGDGEAWTIMGNGSHVIGLFHGMFEGNILTFNPGWSEPGVVATQATDIREIATDLRAAGVPIENDTTVDTISGPASFSITDPDGNAILVDQHV